MLKFKLFLFPLHFFLEVIEYVLVNENLTSFQLFDHILKAAFSVSVYDCSAPNGEEILNESEVKLDAVRRKIKQVAQELIGEDMYQFHRAISPGKLF